MMTHSEKGEDQIQRNRKPPEMPVLLWWRKSFKRPARGPNALISAWDFESSVQTVPVPCALTWSIFMAERPPRARARPITSAIRAPLELKSHGTMRVRPQGPTAEPSTRRSAAAAADVPDSRTTTPAALSECENPERRRSKGR